MAPIHGFNIVGAKGCLALRTNSVDDWLLLADFDGDGRVDLARYPPGVIGLNVFASRATAPAGPAYLNLPPNGIGGAVTTSTASGILAHSKDTVQFCG